MKKTMRDLRSRTIRAIENKEDIAYDEITSQGQIYDNVAHMRWAKLVVMKAIAESSKEYHHLLDQVPTS